MGWWRNVKCKAEVLNYQSLYGSVSLDSFIKDTISLGNHVNWEVGNYYAGKTLMSWCVLASSAVKTQEIVFTLRVLKGINSSGYLKCKGAVEVVLVHTITNKLTERLKSLVAEVYYTPVLNKYLGVGGWN